MVELAALESGMGQLIEGSNPSLSAIDIMKITIITIGKKHEAWVQPGIFRFFRASTSTICCGNDYSTAFKL